MTKSHLSLLGLFVVLTMGFSEAASWSDAPVALTAVSVPIIVMLVIALTIFFAFAWYRVVTGKSIEPGKED